MWSHFTLSSTINAVRGVYWGLCFPRTRPTVFSEQDRSSYPNKTDHLFRKRPTVFSEQDRPAFPNKTDRLIRIRLIIFSEKDRPSFPNKIDRLFRTRSTVFSEQDRPSFPKKTDRLFRTRPIVLSATSFQVSSKTHSTMIVVNIFLKNSPLAMVLSGLGPMK